MLYKFITTSFSVNREKPLECGTNHTSLKSNISFMIGLTIKGLKSKSIAFSYGRFFQHQQLRLTNERKRKIISLSASRREIRPYKILTCIFPKSRTTEPTSAHSDEKQQGPRPVPRRWTPLRNAE